jgi:hypothetical protein
LSVLVALTNLLKGFLVAYRYAELRFDDLCRIHPFDWLEPAPRFESDGATAARLSSAWPSGWVKYRSRRSIASAPLAGVQPGPQFLLQLALAMQSLRHAGLQFFGGGRRRVQGSQQGL